MSAKPYYEWLEIAKSASTQEIKKAYRKLALKYHPDKQKGFEQRFREIAEAYEILGNDEKRMQFDHGGVNFDIVFKSSAQVFRECFGDDEELPTHPVVQIVSPQRIFNLPIYDHQSPIIDTRSADLYSEGHVMGSLNLPPGRNLMQFFEEFEMEFCPDDFSEIVIIGLSEFDNHAVQVANAIEELIMHPITAFSDHTSAELQSFQKKLAKSAKREVLVIAGGASAFRAAYPGCFGQLGRDECCQTPVHIHGHVFLGSRDFLRGHAKGQSVSAGIERAIVPSEDMYQEVGGGGINDYFMCDAPYQDAESMVRCWGPIIDYIDSSSSRVLVILHNRSQSASAVLAWLVRGRPQMQVRAAARLMRLECPRINWSLAFCEHVVEFDTDRKEWLNSYGVVMPAPKGARVA